jgi:hypothetical protein
MRSSNVRTDEYFQERIRRPDRAKALRILDRAGKGNPPQEGDELPPDLEGAGEIRKPFGRATPLDTVTHESIIKVVLFCRVPWPRENEKLAHPPLLFTGACDGAQLQPGVE